MFVTGLKSQSIGTEGTDGIDGVQRIGNARKQRIWTEPYRQTMTNTEKEIKVALFDWDLTLARVLGEVSSNERLAALFQREGLPYTLDEIQTAVNDYQTDVQQGKLRATRVPPQTRQDVIQYYRHLLNRLGHIEASWELADRLYGAYSYLPTVLYDDCLPTLMALKQRGITLGIISNHATSIREVIQQHLGDLISPENIVISQEVGVHKPAKTIFRRAAARLRMPPANCLFVGDNLVVDAIGAVQRGGFGIGLWLDRKRMGNDRVLPEGVFRITSLLQVLDYV